MRSQNARKLLRRALPSGDKASEIAAGKVFLEQYFAGAPYGMRSECPTMPDARSQLTLIIFVYRQRPSHYGRPTSR